MIIRRENRATAMLLAGALLPLLAVGAESDQRQAFDGESPAWLQAVGRLHVPAVRYREGYGNHRNENCSATLVARAGSPRADTLVTAWHCLEDYRDLSHPITVSWRAGDGSMLRVEAYPVADGGGMHADWALLKLFRPIGRETVASLAVHPGRADTALPVTMAGYSGDDGLGDGGATLTYHANCRITRQSPRESESDCLAFKGASGGAVIQLDAAGRAQLCGVVSRGDGETVSLFVPVAGFRSALNRYLN